MAKNAHQSVIELNGLRYNAQTGALLGPVKKQTTVRSFVQDIAMQPSVLRAVSPSKTVHKAAQASHTLMRKAVKKPSVITDHKTVAMDVVSPKPHQASVEVFHSTDPSRTKRAASVPKLSLISRFGVPKASVKTKHISIDGTSVSSAPTTVAASPILTAPVYASSTSKSSKVIEQGLRTADSHTRAPLKKKRVHHRVAHRLGISNRAAGMVVASFMLVVIGGFVAYQNIPGLDVRYAGMKAGVNASMPTYQPAGFAVNNHIQYAPGELSIAYHANADDRTYTLSQKNTSWNSQALKDHITSQSTAEPQSYADNGRTIYLHDGTAADWVEGGVWYSISGNSKLTTDQLIKIATSL